MAVLVAMWTAAGAALHLYRGTHVRGTAAAGAGCGKGKTNGPLHIAAMTLAELGHSTADIHRTLQSAGVRDLKDRAQIRRMIRSVRAS